MRKQLFILPLLTIFSLSVYTYAQDAALGAEEQRTWTPPEGVAVYALSGERIILRTGDGTRLEHPTSVLGKFNRLYVFDGELGHAYLFDAGGSCLTQLTDPRQPTYYRSIGNGSEVLPTINDADSCGRLLFNSTMLVDGLQYHVPLPPNFMDVGLFQGMIVTLTHPQGENWREKGMELAAFSTLGGRIQPPWAHTKKGEWYSYIATLEDKLYLLNSGDRLLTVIDASGASRTVHLEAIHRTIERKVRGGRLPMPHLSYMRADEQALYFEINTAAGKNYICAFSHEYELTAVYELTPTAPPVRFLPGEFAVCYAEDTPTFYVLEAHYAEGDATKRRLMRYHPAETAKAQKNQALRRTIN